MFYFLFLWPLPSYLLSTHKQCILSHFIPTLQHCNVSLKTLYPDGIRTGIQIFNCCLRLGSYESWDRIPTRYRVVVFLKSCKYFLMCLYMYIIKLLSVNYGRNWFIKSSPADVRQRSEEPSASARIQRPPDAHTQPGRSGQPRNGGQLGHARSATSQAVQLLWRRAVVNESGLSPPWRSGWSYIEDPVDPILKIRLIPS
jgi:hypothetical protein